MHMQRRELAAIIAVKTGCRRKPRLPPRVDIVMPDTWSITNVERRALRLRQACSAVVCAQERRTMRKTSCSDVPTCKQCGQWVELNTDQVSIGETATSGHKEACRSSPGVDNTSWCNAALRP